MVVQAQVEDDWLLVPVQEYTCVTFEVISDAEAEEVKSSDGGCEHTWHKEGLTLLPDRGKISDG